MFWLFMFIDNQQSPVAALKQDSLRTNSTCIGLTWTYVPDFTELDPRAVTVSLERVSVDTSTPTFVRKLRGLMSYTDCGLKIANVYSYKITTELE